MVPPSPLSDVDADMVVFSAIVRFSVSILMVPASPLPVLSTEIKPSPEISMFSGALMLMLPPLPMDVVRADIKPCSVKVMLRLGSVLYGWSLRVPAGLSPAVSANTPSLPEMNSSLALMVIFPPASVLVAFSLAVALI